MRAELEQYVEQSRALAEKLGALPIENAVGHMAWTIELLVKEVERLSTGKTERLGYAQLQLWGTDNP